MDDEFKLCWKNFQDNIASGFQSLYDRGDLVDVTLACDGKLLQAHKIVLAICSPYFQEIFISNPCKHPIIILKDVTYNIMCELLEFMYQGVVNVKHTELQAFMKIGQLLQIKGLATNSSSSAASTSSDKSSNYNHSNKENDVESTSTFTAKPVNASATTETVNNGDSSNNAEKPPPPPTSGSSNPNTPQRSQSPALSPASPTNAAINVSTMNQAHKSQDSQLPLHHPYHQNVSAGGSSGLKRHTDYNSDSLSIFSRNKLRRSLTSTDHSSENNDGTDGGGAVVGGMDQMNTEDFFLPHISMVESRYDLNSIKRESAEHHSNHDAASAAAVAAAASATLRNTFNSAAFGLDYTFYKNNSGGPTQSSQEYPNDLHMSNEYSKSFANHMDIPPNCPNVVMLSSTSLLHGSCVFNRNNTVATQQGMKTYWLCKSYRISMCRARCITHQGKIISATGVHNHAPHMRGNNPGGSCGGAAGGGGGSGNGSNAVVNSANIGSNNNNNGGPATSSQIGNNSGGGLSSSASSGANALGYRFPSNTGSSGNSHHQNFHEHQNSSSSPPPPPMYATHSHMHPNNSGNSNMASHHYLQSMPNLLVQHHPGSQTLVQQQMQQQQPSPNLTMPPTQNTSVVQHMMHSGDGGIHHPSQTHANYDLSPAMQTSPSTHSSFDPSEKTLNSLNKDHLNDDQHLTTNNTAHSPSVMHNKTGPADAAHTHDNEIITKMSSSEHQQAQMMDAIEISPNCGHNFKLESM